jgi:hypothetical protein
VGRRQLIAARLERKEADIPPAAGGSFRDEDRQGFTPSSLGFRMPAEWEPHERCIIGWPRAQASPD